MRYFKAQNNCNVSGAWLMLRLKDDDIPDTDETVVVIEPSVALC